MNVFDVDQVDMYLFFRFHFSAGYRYRLPVVRCPIDRLLEEYLDARAGARPFLDIIKRFAEKVSKGVFRVRGGGPGNSNQGKRCLADMPNSTWDKTLVSGRAKTSVADSVQGETMLIGRVSFPQTDRELARQKVRVAVFYLETIGVIPQSEKRIDPKRLFLVEPGSENEEKALNAESMQRRKSQEPKLPDSKGDSHQRGVSDQQIEPDTTAQAIQRTKEASAQPDVPDKPMEPDATVEAIQPRTHKEERLRDAMGNSHQPAVPDKEIEAESTGKAKKQRKLQEPTIPDATCDSCEPRVPAKAIEPQRTAAWAEAVQQTNHNEGILQDTTGESHQPGFSDKAIEAESTGKAIQERNHHGLNLPGEKYDSGQPGIPTKVIVAESTAPPCSTPNESLQDPSTGSSCEGSRTVPPRPVEEGTPRSAVQLHRNGTTLHLLLENSNVSPGAKMTNVTEQHPMDPHVRRSGDIKLAAAAPANVLKHAELDSKQTASSLIWGEEDFEPNPVRFIDGSISPTNTTTPVILYDGATGVTKPLEPVASPEPNINNAVTSGSRYDDTTTAMVALNSSDQPPIMGMKAHGGDYAKVLVAENTLNPMKPTEHVIKDKETSSSKDRNSETSLRQILGVDMPESHSTGLLGYLPDSRGVRWFESDPQALYIEQFPIEAGAPLTRCSSEFQEYMLSRSSSPNREVQTSPSDSRCRVGENGQASGFHGADKLLEHTKTNHVLGVDKENVALGDPEAGRSALKRLVGPSVYELFEALTKSVVSLCPALQHFVAVDGNGRALLTELHLCSDQDGGEVAKECRRLPFRFRSLLNIVLRMCSLFPVESDTGQKEQDSSINCVESRETLKQDASICNMECERIFGTTTGCSLIGSPTFSESPRTCDGKHGVMLDIARTFLLDMLSTLPDTFIAPSRSSLACFGTDGRESWCEIVKNSACIDTLVQAIAVLVSSLDRAYLPEWWKAEGHGWSVFQLFLSRASWPALFMQLTVLDLCLSEAVALAAAEPIHHCPDRLKGLSYEEIVSVTLDRATKLGIPLWAGEYRSECCVCLDGGELLCCELCPNTAHQTCYKLVNVPDRFVCYNCIDKIDAKTND